jgi:O-antigen/teichoic acid export membrane protein
MTGHQDVNLRISLVVTVLSVVLCYPATVLWGMEGTATVTGTLVAARNLWTWWEVRRNLGISALPLDLSWFRPYLRTETARPSLAGTGEGVE